VNVESEEQSKQYMCTHSPNKPTKFTYTLFARKLIAAVFWDRKIILVVEFMQQGTIITSKVYCKILKKLCKVVRNKKHGMLTPSVVTLQDNAHLCTAGSLLELFDHPPYSPNLAPSDCHLFNCTHLKNWLRSQDFNNNELTEDVRT
jgi:histone-lysine N-methyltransferase SETMAR